MRNRLLGVLTLSSMLAAGAAFAAEPTMSGTGSSTMPGSTAPAAASPASPMAAPAEKPADTSIEQHSGVVKSFNAKTHKLTLKDGSIFTLDDSLSGTDLKANQKVTFNFKTDGQTKTVTEYKVESNS